MALVLLSLGTPLSGVKQDSLMILDPGRDSSLRAADPSLKEAPEPVSGKECRDDPLRVLPDAIQHLPSPRHNQYALLLTALPFLGMDGRRIEVTHPRIAIERYSAFLRWWKRLRPRAVVSEWQLATQFGSGFRGPCVLRIIFSHPQRTPPRGSSTATPFSPPCLRCAASRSRPGRIAIRAIFLGRP